MQDAAAVQHVQGGQQQASQQHQHGVQRDGVGPPAGAGQTHAGEREGSLDSLDSLNNN